MRFGSVGAVIAAASKKDAVPLLKVGSIPIVRRIVLTLQQAGVFPIVVVTGTEELEVIRQVAPLGVVFIKNKECEKPELFSSVKLGLSYLQGKCDRVVFTPVNAPMFFAQTLHAQNENALFQRILFRKYLNMRKRTFTIELALFYCKEDDVNARTKRRGLLRQHVLKGRQPAAHGLCRTGLCSGNHE